MSYLKRPGTRRPPQWAPIPGSDQVPNSPAASPGRSTTGRGCVASCPRLRGRHLLRVRVEADTRERPGGRALRPRGRRACGRGDRACQPRGPRAEERSGALRARAGSRHSATRRRARPRSTRSRSWRERARTCSSSRTFVEGFRGWGRSLRRAVGRWYAAQPVDALAYQVVKYRQRDGVTHRDLLRLAHPARRVGGGQPTLDGLGRHARLFEWIVRGGDTDGLPRLVEGFVRAQAAETAAETAALVREYGLPREALRPST